MNAPPPGPAPRRGRLQLDVEEMPGASMDVQFSGNPTLRVYGPDGALLLERPFEIVLAAPVEYGGPPAR